MRMLNWMKLALTLSGYAVSAGAWSFTVDGQPQTCGGPLNISWSGGSPPYTFSFLHPPEVSQSRPPTQFWGAFNWVSGVVVNYTFQQAYPNGFAMDITNASYTPMVIVGSDSTGFGTGGTSQAFEVLAPPQPLPAGCSVSPQNSTMGVGFLNTIYTNISQCHAMNITLDGYDGYNLGYINVDTIVPNGDSYRTVINDSATDGVLIWPLTASVGSNVSFAVSNSHGPLFITPLVNVTAENASCPAEEGTTTSISSAIQPTQTQSMSGTDRGMSVTTLRSMMAVVVFIAFIFV
ncbi:hypothetical protein CALCODRAFT_499154 [Calocera cornea HHB12733]|uniref:Uncharacterized protein n=1 Tax=Calocera cornea HHB12733 TaxID=1353952 RepID=A0A165EIZ3_9BASI|nr:hypothetical protein CALCODRAFT_499154 [Calocera cornea HHB12733]